MVEDSFLYANQHCICGRKKEVRSQKLSRVNEEVIRTDSGDFMCLLIDVGNPFAKRAIE